MLEHLAKFNNSTKVLKEYVINKLRSYTERMQKNLSFATQKYIGDCDEPKIIRNVYDTMRRIICNPIADIFVGKVSIFVITYRPNMLCIIYLYKYYYYFFF